MTSPNHGSARLRTADAHSTDLPIIVEVWPAPAVAPAAAQPIAASIPDGTQTTIRGLAK